MTVLVYTIPLFKRKGDVDSVVRAVGWHREFSFFSSVLTGMSD